MSVRLLIGVDPSAPAYEFSRAEIRSRSLQVVTAVDVVGSELAADELYADVNYTSGEAVWFSPADYDGVMTADGFIFAAADVTPDLALVPYATPVWLMDGATVRHKLYFREAVQIDPRTYSLTAQSGVGVLERRRHLGGLYTGQTVSTVLAEIIGDAFSYSAAPAVASQAVYGLLLADSARANLHKLLFALGISLTKAADGSVQFVFLDAETDGGIPSSRTFLGGTVTFQTPVTAVSVTEHAYFSQSVTTETLFDNSGDPAVDHALIEFNNAFSNLTTTGSLIVNESGPTYAVVSGSGMLAGRPYVHVTRTVRLLAADPSGGEKVLTSDQDTLINSLNSLSVAHRLLAYYTSRKTVNLPIRVDGERAGQNVDFADPFGGTSNGFILKSQAVITGFEKASMEMVVGYVPTGQGNWYSQRTAITASGSFTVPAGVTHLRMVLIQGGSGGQGGMNGEDGLGGDKAYGGDLTFVDGRLMQPQADVYYEYADDVQAIPQGGAAGAAGAAGRVLVVDLDVTPGDTMMISVGAGGFGGSGNGGAGAAGGHTTLAVGGTTYTSADGAEVAGYADPLSGTVYALPGETGHAGGNGGRTDIQSLTASTGSAGYQGESVGSYVGGVGGQGKRNASWSDVASGGGGGGAAWGASGGAGEDGLVEYRDSRWRHLGGDGGDGADAAAPSAPTYGCGGAGGNGGGAGGNGAGCREKATAYPTSTYYPGNGGSGGAGSAGGQGGPGICLIFY